MKRDLSVLILSPHPQTQGGVSTYVETLKKHLRNCEVTSFWVGAPTQLKENLLSLMFRLLAGPFKVAGLAWRKQFDFVHINPSLDKKALVRDGLILLALVLTGYRRIMIFFHGWDADFAAVIRRNIILRQPFVFLLNRSAHIVVLAPEFKTTLVQMGVEAERVGVSRTMVEGNGVASTREPECSPPLEGGVRGGGLKLGDLFQNAQLNTPSFSPIPNVSQRRSILFMSRFDKRKGVYELLEAFASIAAEFPDCDLVMAGDGVENAALQQRARQLDLQNRVLFPGYVSGQVKTDLLHQCMLFALPTYYPEGMPLAVLEAMAAGKPLLTTQAGGLKQTVTDSENGVVLETVNVDTVAAGLRRLLSNATFCAEAGQRNTAAAQRFDAAIVAAEIEDLYHDIACQK